MTTPARFLQVRTPGNASRVQDNINQTLQPVAEALQQTPIMGAPAPDWVTLLPLQNGFAATGGGQASPAYHRDALGYVWVKAAFTSAAGAAANTVVCALPVGYRPAETLHFAVKGTAGTVQFISVAPSGDCAVEVAVAAGGFVDVSFSFLAEG